MMTIKKEQFTIISLLFIMFLIIGYFVKINLPYWCFKLEHVEVQGKIETVKKIHEEFYKINYSFISIERDEKRNRSLNTSVNFKEGDKVTVMYNKDFPNYVEIKEINTSVNLLRTLLPVIVPLICVFFLILGLLGKVDLDKFS